MPFQMKKSNPSVSTHSPAQCPHALTHLHTSFSPKHSPGPAEPIFRQHPPLASPVCLPASPTPSPFCHPHPLSTGKHIFFHIHHVEVGCAFWCQNTHGRLRQQRLHGCTELLLCWWIAVGFCGMVLAVPGRMGRSQELALAINTDLLRLVWCQVSHSLLRHLSVCPLLPCCGASLCCSEAKPDVFCKAGGCLADWQHHWHHNGIVG